MKEALVRAAAAAFVLLSPLPGGAAPETSAREEDPINEFAPMDPALLSAGQGSRIRATLTTMLRGTQGRPTQCDGKSIACTDNSLIVLPGAVINGSVVNAPGMIERNGATAPRRRMETSR